MYKIVIINNAHLKCNNQIKKNLVNLKNHHTHFYDIRLVI